MTVLVTIVGFPLAGPLGETTVIIFVLFSRGLPFLKHTGKDLFVSVYNHRNWSKDSIFLPST